VTADLERDGVRSFCDSYDQLLERIESKLGVVAAPAKQATVDDAVRSHWRNSDRSNGSVHTSA
jgi:hypothetical protein